MAAFKLAILSPRSPPSALQKPSYHQLKKMSPPLKQIPGSSSSGGNPTGSMGSAPAGFSLNLKFKYYSKGNDCDDG